MLQTSQTWPVFRTQSNEANRLQICPARRLSAFQDLEPDLLELVNDSKRTNFYRKGEILFHEGNPAFGLYCINSGRVKLYKTTEDGKHLFLRIANPGDQLGYLALFADQPYSATAQVMEDGAICFVDRRCLYPLIEKNRDMGLAIIRTLAEELTLSQNLARDIAYRSVRERMAGLLLLLKERYGQNHASGTLINLSLSREDFAEIIGTSLETAVRILSDFRKEELIEDEDHHVVVQKPRGLAEIAGFQD